MKTKTFFQIISIMSFLSLLIPLSSGQLAAQKIYTVAGNGVKGLSGDGGPATAAELNHPQNVAVDAMGNIYIPDSCYGVREVNSAGIISTVAGNGIAGFSGDGGPATAAELNFASSAVTDGAGNIYIADVNNDRIRKVNSAGIISTIAGNGFGSPGSGGFSGDGGPATAAELFYPVCIAIDNAGNIYIGEGANDRIRLVNTAGIISTIAGNGTYGFSGDGGPATAAELNYPNAMSVDTTGNIYFADINNNRIRMINTSGIISTIAGNGYGSPNSGGFSGDGGPATAAEFYSPDGVSLDGAGNIYIADNNNNRIRKINIGDTITTVAGNGYGSPISGGFSGDGGPATAAEFFGVGGVAADTKGNFYIDDWHNNRIREVIKDSTMAVKDLEEKAVEIGVYPNPNNGVFCLQAPISPQEENYIVKIYNMLGIKVVTTSAKAGFNQLDLSALSAGIYMIRVQTANTAWQQKIVIIH